MLQSVLVQLHWGGERHLPSHAAHIDYTVSNLGDLARLPERDLSIMLNESASGVHRLIVNGRSEQPFGVTLFEADMAGGLASARTRFCTTIGSTTRGGGDVIA